MDQFLKLCSVISATPGLGLIVTLPWLERQNHFCENGGVYYHLKLWLELS
jgi:hypothetical protein